MVVFLHSTQWDKTGQNFNRRPSLLKVFLGFLQKTCYNIVELECFSNYFQKNYTILRLEDFNCNLETIISRPVSTTCMVGFSVNLILNRSFIYEIKYY